MGYKCEYDGEDGCGNCKNRILTDNLKLAFKNKECHKCIESADECPLNQGYNFPMAIQACERCGFEPKEREEK